MRGRLRIHGTPIEEFGRRERRVLSGVVDALSAVATEFGARDGVTEDDYVTLLRDPSSGVSGTDLGQRPASFVEQYLVHPLLESLGFDYVVAPRMRFEPFEPTDADAFCDFRITNASYARGDRPAGPHWDDDGPDPPREYGPEVVGETAPPNGYTGAKETIRAAYAHPFKQLDVGIATDGLDWGVYVGVPRAECWEEFSLRPFALKIADHVYDGSVPDATYAGADDSLLSLLRVLQKPNFERFLLQRDVDEVWD